MQTDPTPPRRRLRAAALGAGWLAATAGVAAGAWLAVSAAGDGLGTGQRVLTADQVRARLADVDGTGGPASTPPTGEPTAAPGSADQPDDAPVAGSGATPGASPSGPPEGSGGGGSAPGGGSSSGSGDGSGDGSDGTRPGGSVATSRPVTSAPAAPVRTSAVATSGGTAAVSCQGAVVSLRYATPRDGWTVAVQDRGPEKVEVVFARPTGDGSGGSGGSGDSSGDHGSGGSGGGDQGGHGPEATAKATCVGGTPVWETEQH